MVMGEYVNWKRETESKRESSDDHWDSTSRRFLNFSSLDTAGGGGERWGRVCFLSTLQHTRELCIFLVEGRKKWVKRNIPGIIYCYFTITLDGLTWVKFFFFLILSAYVFERRRTEVRWYIVTEVYKENEWKRKVTGQLKNKHLGQECIKETDMATNTIVMKTVWI